MYQSRKEENKENMTRKDIKYILNPYIISQEIKDIKKFDEGNDITYYIVFANENAREKICNELIFMGFKVYTYINRHIQNKMQNPFVAKVVVSSPPQERRRLGRPKNSPKKAATKE